MKFYIRTLHSKGLHSILSIGLGIFLLYVSMLPHSYIEKSGYPEISKYFDMMNHFLGFLLFNFFLFSALLVKTNGCLARMSLTIYFVIAICWGLLIESVQLFDETRSFQLIDVIRQCRKIDSHARMVTLWQMNC